MDPKLLKHLKETENNYEVIETDGGLEQDWNLRQRLQRSEP